MQKRGGPPRLALAILWQKLATHSNEHCDGGSFDAIFDVLDGEATPGIHDSGERDIKMEAPRNRCRRASRGEEGVRLMPANSPWRQLQVRAEIPGDQKHDYALRAYSHTLNALRSSIQNTNPCERVAGNAGNDIQNGAVSRTGVVAWCRKEQRRSSRLSKHLRFPSAQVEVTVNLHTPRVQQNLNMSLCEQTSSVVFLNIVLAWGK